MGYQREGDYLEKAPEICRAVSSLQMCACMKKKKKYYFSLEKEPLEINRKNNSKFSIQAGKYSCVQKEWKYLVIYT